MIKGTRMIVITKNKIIAALCLIVLFGICVSAITAVVKSSDDITAFSSYEEILTKEITPAREKEGKKFTEVISEVPGKILKHFFVLDEIQTKKEETAPEETAPEETAAPEQPILKSESKRADKGLKVSNATSFDVHPENFLNIPLAILDNNQKPEILIMHTHTTESYSEEQYPANSPDRNLDETKNIVAVGNAMEEVFKSHGIMVYHDTTVHDYPSYNGAYQRAATTICNNLNKHSGIKVVLDVHRDGITKPDGTKVKLVAEVNGEDTAQVMLVVGSNANLQHDNWQENFKFASQIQAKAIELFPSLMRPIDLRQERFNEQLTLGSLIVEVGTNGNTIDEAIRGGRDAAEAISQVLKQ